MLAYAFLTIAPLCNNTVADRGAKMTGRVLQHKRTASWIYASFCDELTTGFGQRTQLQALAAPYMHAVHSL